MSRTALDVLDSHDVARFMLSSCLCTVSRATGLPTNRCQQKLLLFTGAGTVDKEDVSYFKLLNSILKAGFRLDLMKAGSLRSWLLELVDRKHSVRRNE